MAVYRITVPSRVGIKTIEKLVEQTWPVFEAASENESFEFILDLSEVDYIYAAGLTTLTAAALYLIRHPAFIRGELLRPKDSDVDNYINRMGFYDLLKVLVPYPFQRHDSTGRFIEIVEVKSEMEVESISTALATIISEQCNLVSSEEIEPIKYALSELIENVFHHANSPVHAIVFAQTMQAQRTVELAIVDCGRGFRESLLSNIAYSGKIGAAPDAIRLAIQARVTGNPSRNSGEGLFFTTEMIKKNRGDMVIMSEDGLYRIKNGREKLEHLCYNGFVTANWKGAIAALLIHVDRPVSMKELFDEHTPPDADYDWLFDDNPLMLDEDLPF